MDLKQIRRFRDHPKQFLQNHKMGGGGGSKNVKLPPPLKSAQKSYVTNIVILCRT